MKEDIVVRKVVQDVMLFIIDKYSVIENAPKPELSFTPGVPAELTKNLSGSVWIETARDSHQWGRFYKTHLKRMTSSPWMFAKYVAYACYFKILGVEDAYDGFLRTLSVVAHIVVGCWKENCKSFLNVYVDLVCEFFEKELRDRFEEQGGWKNLNSFLVTQENYKKFTDLTNKKDGNFVGTVDDERDKIRGSCAITGVVLKDVKPEQIENHESSVAFANSIAGKIKKLSNLSVTQLLMNFSIVDAKVKELFMKQVGELSARADPAVEMPALQDSIQKEKSEYTPDSNESKKDRVSVPFHFKTEDSSAVELQDIAASDEAPDPDSQTSVMGKAKKLLQDMLKDIEKISHLLMFIFNDAKEVGSEAENC